MDDERDEHIHRRAEMIGYKVFWLCFVAWGVLVPWHFWDAGQVPLAFVAPVVYVGFLLVMFVRGVAILVLCARG